VELLLAAKVLIAALRRREVVALAIFLTVPRRVSFRLSAYRAALRRPGLASGWQWCQELGIR
jgi:hypothetical protein